MKLSYDEFKERHPHDTRPGAWPRIEYEGRRTGRTYRMMAEAQRLVAAGHKVYIIVHSADYGRDLAHKFGTHPSVAYETFYSLPNFNRRSGRLVGAHPNCRVLIDHYAIESEYSELLIELHRFDGKLPEGME